LIDITIPDFSTPPFQPQTFNHELFNLNHESGVEKSRLRTLEVEKYGLWILWVGKSRFEEFMVEKFGVEKSWVESWG
jgi:hypothetical protein